MINVKIFADGSCHNNGKGTASMGIGIVIYVNSKKYAEAAKFVGYGTNNDAEWLALIEALELAKQFVYGIEKPCDIQFYSDSQLVVNQFLDIYKCEKHQHYYKQAKTKLRQLRKMDTFTANWIPRAENQEADVLSKKGNPKYNKIK